ncbi:MAG: hypothetical protein HN929_01850 [Chloroflexi bacterium]|nr:hypothetical protein [Chloroflexota bacterium]MBT7080204.1 hypothetical protein [Chloroflexota bacterium]MBT7290150.1 hypothetical protein [Chloroflexota bacterium]
MLRNILARIHNDNKGITGLETAIILIAFVVVASVFAYTVLSAGIFSSEKGKEAVYEGLDEASSGLVLLGMPSLYTPDDLYLYGEVPAAGTKATNTGAAVARVDFVVGLAASNGTPMDLSPYYDFDANGALQVATHDVHKLTIDYQDAYNYFTECVWTANWIGQSSGDYVLENDERVVISVWLTDYNYEAGQGLFYALGNADPMFTDTDDTNTALLDVYHDFTIQLKPVNGAHWS